MIANGIHLGVLLDALDTFVFVEFGVIFLSFIFLSDATRYCTLRKLFLNNPSITNEAALTICLYELTYKVQLWEQVMAFGIKWFVVRIIWDELCLSLQYVMCIYYAGYQAITCLKSFRLYRWKSTQGDHIKFVFTLHLLGIHS